jgi:hypothetical protein
MAVAAMNTVLRLWVIPGHSISMTSLSSRLRADCEPGFPFDPEVTVSVKHLAGAAAPATCGREVNR